MSGIELQTLAKKVLLPVSEVKIWLEHLEEVSRNRKGGTIKAAEIRKQKKRQKQQEEESDTILCDVCGALWEEEIEQWIQVLQWG